MKSSNKSSVSQKQNDLNSSSKLFNNLEVIVESQMIIQKLKNILFIFQKGIQNGLNIFLFQKIFKWMN